MSIIQSIDDLSPLSPKVNGVEIADIVNVNGISNFWPSFTGDDFSGTNGDPPDPNVWGEGDSNNYLDIQSNKLNFHSPVANANPNAWAIANFRLSGNFDVQNDFSITTWDAPTDSLSYAAALRIRDDSGLLGQIALVRSSGNIWYYGSGSGDDTDDTSDTSGQLRAARVGGEIRAWYWDTVSSRWEWNGGTTGYLINASNTNNITIQIYFESENNSGLDTNVTNFVINSGTVIPPHDV